MIKFNYKLKEGGSMLFALDREGNKIYIDSAKEVKITSVHIVVAKWS